MEVTLKKLDKNDIKKFNALIEVFADVFEMENFAMPNNDHLQNLLIKQHFMVFVALRNDVVVAGLTSYVLDQCYGTQPIVYIYDLAVSNEFQRMGIGTKLIAEINNYCKSIGIKEVFVQADLADDYAVDFYRSTGAKSLSVEHFTYML